MRIAFDAQAFVGEFYYRGIGRYVFSLVNELLEQFPEHEIILFNTVDYHSFAKDFSGKNLSEVHIDCGRASLLQNEDEYSEIFGDIVRGFIHEYQIDAFICTNCFETPMKAYNPEWFSECCLCAICYDVIPYVFRNRYLADEAVYNAYMARADFLRKCDKLFAISQSVCDDLVQRLSMDAARVTVIMGAAHKQITKTRVSMQQKKAVFSKFGITRSYILYTGGYDYRKNLPDLINAYGSLEKSIINEYQLVIVCRIPQQVVSRLLSGKAKGINTKNIIFTDWVTDEELLVLYNCAAMMTFPSKYEGLGMPVLEAWQCGLPVLTGDNSSLCEIGQDAALLVDADSMKSIARGLREMLNPNALRHYAALGEERVKRYTWHNTAIAMEAGIRDAKFNPASLTRLAVFSPMPPAHTGVADYTATIVTELAKTIPVDVFIENGSQALPIDNSNICLRYEDEYQPQHYSHTLYEMGNSPFHSYMLPYLKKHGGIVELHDANMNGLAQDIASKSDHPAGVMYSILKEDYNGTLSGEYIQHYNQGLLSDDIVLNGFVLNDADCVFVHSDYAKQSCLTLHPFLQTRTYPLYSASVNVYQDRMQTRKRLHVNEDEFTIGVFGTLNEAKRIETIFNVVQNLCEKYKQLRLILIGEVQDRKYHERIMDLIQFLSIDNYVTIIDKVDSNVILDYMAAVDMVLELCYPYRGESSATCARLMQFGQCVVVNDIGVFGELPDTCCIKIPSVECMTDEEEKNQIANAIESVMGDSVRRNMLHWFSGQYATYDLSVERTCQQLCRYLVEPGYSALTQDVFKSLKARVQRDGYSLQEIETLAKALALSKHPPQPFNSYSTLSCEQILDEIRTL